MHCISWVCIDVVTLGKKAVEESISEMINLVLDARVDLLGKVIFANQDLMSR